MKSLLAVITALVFCGQAWSATVSISMSSNGGPMFATSTGDLLQFGDCIRIGTFNTTGGNLAILQNSNDYAAINALFNPLGEGNAFSGTVTQVNNSGSFLTINDFFGTGNVLGQIANIEASYIAAGTQLFAWVFDSALPENATQWGIYSSSTGWNFPNGLGSETLASFEIDTVIRGATTGGTTSSDRLSLAPVPEPAGLFLILLTGAMMFVRRSRRR